MKNIKVLRMRLSIVENTPTSDDIIFKISRGSQRPYRAKSKKSDYLYIIPRTLVRDSDPLSC